MAMRSRRFNNTGGTMKAKKVKKIVTHADIVKGLQQMARESRETSARICQCTLNLTRAIEGLITSQQHLRESVQAKQCSCSR